VDAPKLHSTLNNDQFLDAISAPSSNKGAKRKTTQRRTANDLVEISDDSDEEEQEGREPIVS
jgi:DNA-directed RNA polymerase-3 subunit RPC5